MGSQPAGDTAPSAKQIVFLFMAATVVAVVVFLCGVLVGRGVPLGEGLTVSGSAVEGLGVDDLPPPTLSTPSDEPSAAASESDDLTYYRRLSGTEPETETLRVEADDAAAADVAGSADDPSAGGGRPTPPVSEAAETPPAPSGASSGSTTAPPLSEPVSPSAAAASAPDSAPATGGFSVQVAALRSLESAEQVARQLVAKGYPAIVVSPDAGSPVTLFRVRVGPYADRTEAERIRGRLETEEQYDPFVTR